MSSGGKKSKETTSSILGLVYIVLSLSCDGVAAGMQERLRKESKDRGVSAKPYDLMFWTNLYMAATALIFAACLGELQTGVKFCVDNPPVLNMIMKFGLCSAFGQSFIFYTIANFDSLVCTTVTTTRKVFSVLRSIFLNGHSMDPVQWAGLSLASAGILAEMQDKGSKGHGAASAKKPDEKKK